MPKVLFALLLTLTCCVSIFSQSNTNSFEIPVIDMREFDPNEAIWESVQNTKQNAVVVLIRGGNEALLQAVKSKLQALVHQGINRVGIIRSTTRQESSTPSIGIFADGTIYATIKDVESDTQSMWSLYNLVRDAYEEYVVPKL